MIGFSAELSGWVEDQDLVYRFFAVYSRFEYALKRAGFLKRTNGRAEPHRDAFADDLAGRFLALSDPHFREARRFLLATPPRTQIAREGRLAWRPTPRSVGETDERYLLRLSGTIRNNLFHGGKYPYPVGPVAEPARDRQLLEAGMTIVLGAISLHPEVAGLFRELG